MIFLTFISSQCFIVKLLTKPILLRIISILAHINSSFTSINEITSVIDLLNQRVYSFTCYRRIYSDTWGVKAYSDIFKRPATHGPRRPDGPVPQPDFPQFFHSPAVNPRACTDLHRVWTWKMETVSLNSFTINHLNPCFCLFNLLHVVQIKTFSFSVQSSLYRNR